MRTVPSLKPNSTEADGKALLETLGIRSPKRIEASTPDEAQKLAVDLGIERVAVKIQGPGVEHKTELGGVELNVPTNEVAAICRQIAARVRGGTSGIKVGGYLVEEMAPEGIDFMIGAVWEEPFGHLMVVGLGGRDVELIDDVAFGLAPLGREEATAMVGSLRSFPLLRGHRGIALLDSTSLIDALSKISSLCAALGPAISELDVNPIRVLPEGDGVIALDVMMRGSRDFD
jgi:acyl-CoA synthetase (NDP forming)